MREALQKVADQHWRKLCKLHPKLKGEAKPLLVIDKRVKAAFAYANGATKIQLSHAYLQTHYDLFVSDIIGHEVAHCAEFHLGHDRSDHGKTWRALMQELGLEPNVTY